MLSEDRSTLDAVSNLVPANLLEEHLVERGPRAHLVTVGAEGAPHVTSVLVSLGDNVLTVPCGRTTAENAAARPAVTLLWSAPPGESYTLLVDGVATVDTVLADDAPALTIRPTRAVLHRVADAPGEGPTCIRIEP